MLSHTHTLNGHVPMRAESHSQRTRTPVAASPSRTIEQSITKLPVVAPVVPARGSVCACSAVVFAYCAAQASTSARVLRRSGELVSSHTDLFTDQKSLTSHHHDPFVYSTVVHEFYS